VRRTYLAFLLAVVLPAALAAAAGAVLADRAWQELRHDSQIRLGRMALRAFEEDAAPGIAPSPAQVGRATGYRIALYEGSRRVAATEPPPGPDALERSVLEASGSPSGAVLRLPDEGADAAVVSRPGPEARAGAYAVLVVAAEPAVASLPLPLLLVTGLLLLFSSLAGWIQLAGRPGGSSVASLLLLSAVPALTAGVFLIQADRLYRKAENDAERKDLSRALALARLRGVAGEPEQVRALTGFHAWRVQGGEAVATSLPGPAEAVASLPAPPGSFTSTGRVATPEGEAAYVALRLPEGGFVVVTAARSSERTGRFRRGALRAGATLAAWLALMGVGAVAARRRAGS
jgi:hypothetical protein